MDKLREILRSASDLGLQSAPLDAVEGAAHIRRLFDAFKPDRTLGHLMIGHDSEDYPLETAEWDYSLALPPAPVRVFFEQSAGDKDRVVQLNDGPSLCKVMSNCFGMEYFVSGLELDYLIAVNWYVVEVSGTAREWLARRYQGSR